MIMRTAMLHYQVRLPLHTKRTHLTQVRRVFQYSRGNRLIEQQRLIYKLDRCNQHALKSSSYISQVKYAGSGNRPTGSFP